MSNKNINNTRFDESIRNSIQEVEVTPSAQLWDNIAQSLDSTPSITPLAAIIRWSGAIAATLLLVTLTRLIFIEDSSTTQNYEALIAEFEQMPNAPIKLHPIALAEPHYTFTSVAKSEFATLAEVPDEKKYTTEDSTSEDLPKIKPQEVETVQPVEPYTKEVNHKEINHTTEIVGSIDKSKEPIAISMAFAGGVASTSAGSPHAVPYIISDYPHILAEMVPTRFYTPSSAKHRAPITLALSAAYSLNERWSIESGLSYTRLLSEITMSYSQDNLTQKIDFIGIPLRLNYHIFNTSNFEIYTGAGAQIERCISATLDKNKINEKPWHTSLDLALGLQYNINSWLGLYAEPEVTYYATKTTLSTIRKETPINFNLRFGLRFMIE